MSSVDALLCYDRLHVNVSTYRVWKGIGSSSSGLNFLSDKPLVWFACLLNILAGAVLDMFH